jgi:hypothetical protein
MGMTKIGDVSPWIGLESPSENFTSLGESPMRAEIQAAADEIRQSLALLRRHL